MYMNIYYELLLLLIIYIGTSSVISTAGCNSRQDSLCIVHIQSALNIFACNYL